MGMGVGGMWRRFMGEQMRNDFLFSGASVRVCPVTVFCTDQHSCNGEKIAHISVIFNQK